jgi:Rrf2 family iron-sulfur cluster assembly transcriptional regulator
LKLNTTSQYAIQTVSYIAKESETQKVHAKKIAQELDIPYKYLTRITAQLVEAKIIASIRGREGGYVLAKAASDIYIKDILEAVKESLHQQECLLGNKPCNERKKCLLHDKWAKPKEEMIRMFSQTSLADVL